MTTTRALHITEPCSFSGLHHAAGEIVHGVDIDTAWRVIRAGKAKFAETSADGTGLEAHMKIRLPMGKKRSSAITE